jgi:3-hydroxybutyryl-CoA dehydrogenase
MATIAANLDRMISKATEEDKAKQSTNIITYTDIKDGVVGVDLVVEAATENIDLKLSIFKQLMRLVLLTLATNTSSISITQIERWFQIRRYWDALYESGTYHVVEIIRGYSTSDEVTKTIMTLSEKLENTR